MSDELIELPESWLLEEIKTLCEFNPKHDKDIPDNTEISFVPMAALNEKTGTIQEQNSKLLGEVRKGYTHFADGDVIFAKITPCMENGKSAVAKNLISGLACGSTEFHILRSNGVLAPEYLYFFLRQRRYLDMASGAMTGVVGQRRLPKEFLLETKIPLPPLNEQKRIVTKIEGLNDRTQRAKEALEAIPKLCDRFRRSVLDAAFRGDLTANWRKENEDNSTTKDFLIEAGIQPANEANLPSLPNGWAWVLAGNLCNIKSGVALGKKRTPGTQLIELPYLRVANVQRGWLDLNEIKTVLVTPKEAEALYLNNGDILMNEGGDRDKLGRGWVWEEEIKNCIHQNHVFRLRLKTDKVPSRYISYYANEFGQKYFMNQGKQTTNLASISMSKLSNLPLPIAIPGEMELIIQLIEKMFKIIDLMNQEHQKAIKLLDILEQATLSKAFRGELVPQDPDDEPASILLERIRSELEKLDNSKPKSNRISKNKSNKSEKQATIPGLE